MSTLRQHGGPDALGIPRWDFSTNSNACGPCPAALEAVRQADPTQYPDPNYTSLRQSLAAFHGVPPERVLLLASASEGIQRLSNWVKRQGGQHVVWPEHAYGDYALAAAAQGLRPVALAAVADLVWVCEPSSPLGQPAQALRDLWQPVPEQRAVWVLDRAYEPLRLSGQPAWEGDAADQVWQMWTPNKALGLTGVRGAYAIAPRHAAAHVDELEAMGSSWPVGAHGAAMLQAWTQPEVQTWLLASLDHLRAWKAQMEGQLLALGWRLVPSDANFLTAMPPLALNGEHLRAAGIKLRDASSFGLPGYWRISVQSPDAVAALLAVLQEMPGAASARRPMEELA